ncbi:MAG: PH domain-containing protein [Pseudomonadota bacterium]
MADTPEQSGGAVVELVYDEHPKMFADEPGKFILMVLLIPVMVGVIWGIYWYVKNRCTRLIVNTDRVTLTRGILAREQLEVELDSIRTVEIDQTFFDRVFNCGILRIYTAGDRPELVVHGMPDPQRLRSALRSA